MLNNKIRVCLSGSLPPTAAMSQTRQILRTPCCARLAVHWGYKKCAIDSVSSQTLICQTRQPSSLSSSSLSPAAPRFRLMESPVATVLCEQVIHSKMTGMGGIRGTVGQIIGFLWERNTCCVVLGWYICIRIHIYVAKGPLFYFEVAMKITICLRSSQQE